MTNFPHVTTTYILDRIEDALAEAEYARLIADTTRSTTAMRTVMHLSRSLRRFTMVRIHGAPVIVSGLAAALLPRSDR